MEGQFKYIYIKILNIWTEQNLTFISRITLWDDPIFKEDLFFFFFYRVIKFLMNLISKLHSRLKINK